MVRRRIAFLAIVAVAIGACGGPNVSTVPSGPATSATASLPASSELPSAAVSPTPSAAPGDSAFTCSLPVTLAGNAAGATQAHLSTILIGRHSTYDRIVFVYSGTIYPSLRVEKVSPPFTRDPSGLPMTVTGSSFVRIRLEGVRVGYSGRTNFVVSHPELIQLLRQGDFEAIQTWIAGLSKPGCVHVFRLSSPPRLVVDIAH